LAGGRALARPQVWRGAPLLCPGASRLQRSDDRRFAQDDDGDPSTLAERVREGLGRGELEPSADGVEHIALSQLARSNAPALGLRCYIT
jgi:hypothetical protein